MRKSGLSRRAEAAGVQTTYTDERGESRRVAPAHLEKILELLGAGKDHEARGKASRQGIPPCVVLRDNERPLSVPVQFRVPTRALGTLAAMWRIRGELGEVHEVEARLAPERAGRSRGLTVKATLPPALPPGYYHAELEVMGRGVRHRAATQLILVPPRCFLPHPWQSRGQDADRRDRGRLWGLTVQLYGLRTRRNWGIGDFRDLREVMKWAGGLGAAMVGVNPLHALHPGGISPYSPSSRLFHNPLYLDLEGIPDFREDAAIQRRVTSPAFQKRLDRLRRSPVVDYAGVTRIKEPLLRALYRSFRARHLRHSTRHAQAFREFVREEGQALERFAVFEALQRQFMRKGGAASASWRTWPSPYQEPASEAVTRFARQHRAEIEYSCYVQWHCQRQLSDVARAAEQAGLAIGLYTDFAVGIDPGGADAWAYRSVLIGGASVGAPPDLFSPKGQSWGLTPPHPSKLWETGYRFFIESYGRNMRHSGLLRLDHAMNLFRLFWVPDGRPATEGAYVTYPSQDLLGILGLESQRAGVIVVGEDLGTVTPEIRAALMDHGLLSYRLLLFEKDANGQFVAPERYPMQAMTAVSTHDLPTLRGFWEGRDIDHKERLGLYPDGASVHGDREARQRDRQGLLRALVRAGVLSAEHRESVEFDQDVRQAVHRFLARTPCHLFAVSLEDLLDDAETPNIPGADPARYPVWRRKAGDGRFFEEWRRLKGVRDLAAIIREERPSPRTQEIRRSRVRLSA